MLQDPHWLPIAHRLKSVHPFETPAVQAPPSPQPASPTLLPSASLDSSLNLALHVPASQLLLMPVRPLFPTSHLIQTLLILRLSAGVSPLLLRAPPWAPWSASLLRFLGSQSLGRVSPFARRSDLI